MQTFENPAVSDQCSHNLNSIKLHQSPRHSASVVEPIDFVRGPRFVDLVQGGLSEGPGGAHGHAHSSLLTVLPQLLMLLKRSLMILMDRNVALQWKGIWSWAEPTVAELEELVRRQNDLLSS